MATVIQGSITPSVGNDTILGQHGVSSQVDGLLASYLSDWTNTQMAVTVFLVLVAYDQCTQLQVVKMAMIC